MFDKIVYDPEQAEQDIRALLTRKGTTPKQRERMTPIIEAVAESMSYGYVSIDVEGKITQKLLFPVAGLDELTYAARVAPDVMNREIAKLKVDSQTNRNLVYIKAYTGQMEAIINKLEPADRNIADAIALFFQ